MTSFHDLLSRYSALKDFVDLRLLCRTRLTLETALDLFDRKFGTRRSDLSKMPGAEVLA